MPARKGSELEISPIAIRVTWPSPLHGISWKFLQGRAGCASAPRCSPMISTTTCAFLKHHDPSCARQTIFLPLQIRRRARWKWRQRVSRGIRQKRTLSLPFFPPFSFSFTSMNIRQMFQSRLFFLILGWESSGNGRYLSKWVTIERRFVQFRSYVFF